MKFDFSQNTKGGKKETSVPGKIGLTIFFLVFFLMGTAFEIFLILGFTRDINSRTWPQIPCTILESFVVDDNDDSKPYRFAVKYQYVYQNITWQSGQYRFKDSSFSDYQKAQHLVDSYPAGCERVCYVNPKNPAEAVLKHSDLWTMLFIVIPTIFILFGAGGIYGTWSRKAQNKLIESCPRQPKGKIKKDGWGLILFGLVFFAAGTGASYPLLVRPMWNFYIARSWIETPCNIISARVQSHDSDDGTTYSVDILYEYIFDNQTYRSNRYDFIGGSSSGYNRKQAIVTRYEEMKNPVCYVNPDNPSSAVLVRTLTKKNFIGLFPLIFVLAGLAVLIGGIRTLCGIPKAGDYSSGYSPIKTTDVNSASFGSQSYTRDRSAVLKPQTPALHKFLGMLFFCLIWNGIISVFVVEMISGFQSGRPEWCLTLFLIPFELVGIGTIIGVIYLFLALFNPRFTLIISPDNLYPGSDGQLDWKVHGSSGRIRSLTIKLIGREEATYTRGTKTHTDKKVFFEKELLQTRLQHEMTSGQARFSIPSETMHSFESQHNKIIWIIEIHGEIARWPDVSQEYKILISPKAIV